MIPALAYVCAVAPFVALLVIELCELSLGHVEHAPCNDNGSWHPLGAA